LLPGLHRDNPAQTLMTIVWQQARWAALPERCE